MRIPNGWKTKFGILLIAASGGLCIASIWLPEIPDRAIEGILRLGVAICLLGLWSRFCKAFWSLDEKGNPDFTRTKIKARRIPEEVGND